MAMLKQNYAGIWDCVVKLQITSWGFVPEN